MHWIGTLLICTLLSADSSGSAESGSDERNEPITPVVIPDGAPGLVADYLLITRTPAVGSTDCLFVRYYVTRTDVRFVLLDDEPGFNVRRFPIFARELNGLTDPAGTVLRQDRVQFREFRPHGSTDSVPLLSGGSFSYSVKESLSVPELFVSRSKLVWNRNTESPEYWRTLATADLALELVTDTAGYVLSETELARPETTGHRRTAKYQYTTVGTRTVLSELETFLPPRRHLVEDKAGILFEVTSRQVETAATAEDLDGIRRAGHNLAMIRQVPYVHHPRGRSCTVTFAVHSGNGEQMTVPKRITVRTADDLDDHGLRREALILNIRTMEASEVQDVRTETWLPPIPVREDIQRYTAAHVPARFQGASADRDIAEFRRVGKERGYNSSSASLLERMNFFGRNLDMEVWRHDNRAVSEYLREYFAAAADSPLGPYQPEMAVWLMRRIDASGTPAIYSETLDALKLHFRKTMKPADVIVSAGQISALPFAPYATFCWGIESSSSAPVEELNPARLLAEPAPALKPEQRIHRAWLAAKLLPSFRQVQRTSDQGTASFLSGDAKACADRMTEPVISEIANAARAEASSAFQLLNSESALRFRVHLAEIESWSRNDNASTSQPETDGRKGPRK